MGEMYQATDSKLGRSVRGETLAERIQRGPLSLDDALLSPINLILQWKQKVK